MKTVEQAMHDYLAKAGLPSRATDWTWQWGFWAGWDAVTRFAPDRSVRPRLVRLGRNWVALSGRRGLPLRWDERGRPIVQLGKGHPLANKGGWQYAYRYVLAVELGRPLRSHEHCHHPAGLDEPFHVELMLAEYHNALHAWHTCLARRDPETGRFVELDEPGPTVPAPRWKWLIGRAAEGLA